MEFLLEILRRILVCVGNAYVALTEKERHRHTAPPSLEKFCATLTNTNLQCIIQRFFREPTALKTSEKLPAEGRLKNQKYGHLDMLCGTRWVICTRLCSILLGGNTTALPLKQSSYELQHFEAVLLFRWRLLTKTLGLIYSDVQMSRTNIRNKNMSTDGVNTFMQNVIQYFY
ncbi:hypothetical protein T08_11358 [Trichinella sp. T8]|nr:hypothetical protein T08_11358 [Trichinella sp. T8]